MNISRICLTLLLISLAAPVSANNNTLTPSVYKKLERAQEQLQDNQYQPAIKTLSRIIKKSRKNSLDRAMSWHMIAHAHASQNDYPKAINAYENALAQNALHKSSKKSVTVNLGQLYISEKRYQQGITLLEDFLASEQTNNKNYANMHMLIASGYYELNQIQTAIPHVKTAIKLSDKLEESWHQLLLSFYFELDQFEDSAQQLEKMVVLFSDKKLYWKQLSGIYMQLHQEKKALETLQLAWQKNLLDKEQDIVDLSNLLLLQDLPFEAANVLRLGLDNKTVNNSVENWDKLARFYLLAKEETRAINAMKQAVSLSNTPETRLSLAKIYMANERWGDAEELLTPVRNKPNATEVSYFLAIALFEQNKRKQSNVLFSSLLNDPVFGKKVKPWVSYLARK